MITVPIMSPYVAVGSHSDASFLDKKKVTDLYQQMKEQNDVQPKATRSVSSAANLTSLCVDISPSSSNFYEVLYIGKITAWNKKVPDTFIDDALEKFKAHDLEKNRKKFARLRSENNLRRGSNDSTTSDSKSAQNTSSPNLQRSRSMFLNLSSKSPVVDRKVLQSIGNLNEEVSDGEETPISETCKEENKFEEDTADNPTIQPKPSSDIDDHNRTMVLQIDRTDLRLISPDRKIILLHKTHNEVTTCLQGIIKPDYFGFICNTYTGYVFKCESSSVAGEAVGAIRQAFNNADARQQRAIPTTCEHCPMIWFHKLCCEVENLNDKMTQNVIIKRVKQLDEEEQTVILTKFHGVETDSLRDQNEFLMMLLRAHCEMKQGRHVHDTAENRSEFLNQYLGGNAIFMKAKKSLASSFDNLLKRKASSSDLGLSIKEMSLPVQPVLREPSPSATTDASDSEGSRSSVTGSQTDLRESNAKTMSPEKPGAKSPMMDIFLKVGSPMSASSDEGSPKQDVGSWRQAIFKRVVTPNKQTTSKKRSTEELRALWKKSIHEAILLIRMEKENARLKARQEESAVKRIKLEYDEMKSSERGVMEVWEMVTNKEARIKCDHQMLLNAIRQGVPRGKRGEVWSFLAEQFCVKMPPIDTTKFPYYNVTYEQILKQLTSHQHAILIDLGRTFPSHTYYSSPLGPGQLALFNLLKAYSLLDPDVGYCQGLCFVAGVLLLHMDESQAFFLLRHLMFRRGLRKQYLPDMIGLQIQLYQLSRLLHDQIPELYEHFDAYEVAPTLYAAPWLLTIFASQFPLGFVTRVFDLMFFESTDVVFRVALALLSHHKDSLLECDSLEEIMNYLKTALPAMDKSTMEKIMKQVYTTDISRQLNEYQVEYNVLQEEMQSVQPQVEAFHKLQVTNKTLSEQNKALGAQLEMALSNVQRLEKTRTVQQSSINRLEMQNRGLEVTVGILASFISNLVDEKKNIEIPGEVRRIMSQVSQSERRKNEPKNSNNFMNMFKKSENVVANPNRTMVKSLSTGRIGIPNIEENQMLRTNSLSTKNAGFFSHSYNHIMQQKLQTQNLLNRRIDEKLVDCSEKEEMKELLLDKNSPTNSLDSGVSTPGTTPDSPKNTNSADPLSNCDVTCTYNTRELKKVGSLRNITRNSSPDIIGK